MVRNSGGHCGRHVNGIEDVLSLFKRSIVGAFHKIRVKHFGAYLQEQEFRINIGTISVHFGMS
jgi:hypothetical protein